MALDATVNPDFSQVESDAGQVTVNQRFALFYPEKRPFFLEGIELFNTPNQLVYTRQIVDPIGGGKFTGKIGSLSVAHLTALDEDAEPRPRLAGETGPVLADAALFNITRVRGDVLSVRRASGAGVEISANTNVAAGTVTLKNNCPRLRQSDLVVLASCERAVVFRITNTPATTCNGTVGAVVLEHLATGAGVGGVDGNGNNGVVSGSTSHQITDPLIVPDKDCATSVGRNSEVSDPGHSSRRQAANKCIPASCMIDTPQFFLLPMCYPVRGVSSQIPGHLRGKVRYL